ncbi:unnamed protein product [Pleuronectes platessa]|uniref:Uncharacterized protein n=1 Tax=Pleuronectes platessa TaxID=8262 RepID=A0A9N7Z1I9_PLEPL|nr:unnamed protein product [Pleuronectes platessa]
MGEGRECVFLCPHQAAGPVSDRPVSAFRDIDILRMLLKRHHVPPGAVTAALALSHFLHCNTPRPHVECVGFPAARACQPAQSYVLTSLATLCGSHLTAAASPVQTDHSSLAFSFSPFNPPPLSQMPLVEVTPRSAVPPFTELDLTKELPLYSFLISNKTLVWRGTYSHMILRHTEGLLPCARTQIHTRARRSGTRSRLHADRLQVPGGEEKLLLAMVHRSPPFPSNCNISAPKKATACGGGSIAGMEAMQNRAELHVSITSLSHYHITAIAVMTLARFLRGLIPYLLAEELGLSDIDSSPGAVEPVYLVALSDRSEPAGSPGDLLPAPHLTGGTV